MVCNGVLTTRGKKQNLWTRQRYPFGAGIVASGFAELGTRSLHKAGEKGVDREDAYVFEVDA